MSGSDQYQGSVIRFPLVGPDTPPLTVFIAVVRRLSIAHSLPELMEIVTHAARILLSADGITFVLREHGLCYYAEEDSIAPLWKGRRFPMSACISGWCMLERRAAVIPDVYLDDRIPKDAYRPTFVRSLLMVPVRQDDPIAAMGAYWAHTREISASEVELLQCIANAAALAMSSLDRRRKRRVAPGSLHSEKLLDGLTSRQMEVLKFLAEGKTNAEIARLMRLSPNTIKLHVSAVLRCLNVGTRTQAAILASTALKSELNKNRRVTPRSGPRSR